MPSRRERANAIRALSMDAVQKANSGHPGAPMGMADIAEVLWRDYLKHNPQNPNFADRDRVVLSNGMLLDLGRDPGADAPDPHGLPGALPFAARIQRFVQAWPAVAGRLEGRTITQADLRYPNGFALALAPLPPSETKSKSIPKPPKKR